MSRYRTIFNPATGEHIQYVVTGLESGGAVVRYRWTSDPGGSIVPHTHPGSAEIFSILDGEASFVVGGERLILTAGQSAVVPVGVVHSQANVSGSLVRGIVELTPAARTAELHDALAGISADLPHTPAGAPKSPLQLGATFWAFRHDIRAVSPPIWLQSILLPVLAAGARTLGVRPSRPEWDSRLRPQDPDEEPLFDERRFQVALRQAGYGFAITEPRPLLSPRSGGPGVDTV